MHQAAIELLGRPAHYSNLLPLKKRNRSHLFSAAIRREYRAAAYRCASCGVFQRAKPPEHATRSGFIGDGLAAALVFLNARGHASHSTLSAFMKDVLGEGVISCDYFSAYHKYITKNDARAQFCHAHLIRELRFLAGHSDPATKRYANPEVEPTNNRIRQVAIDRAASQGTRSRNGRDYKKRMWTVLDTCAMRGVSAYHFIQNALNALANNTGTPSLLTL